MYKNRVKDETRGEMEIAYEVICQIVQWSPLARDDDFLVASLVDSKGDLVAEIRKTVWAEIYDRLIGH